MSGVLDVVRPWAAAWFAASLPFALAYVVDGKPAYWGLVGGAFCVLGVLAHRWVQRWQDGRGFDEALAQHWLTTPHGGLHVAPEPDESARLRADETRRYGLEQDYDD